MKTKTENQEQLGRLYFGFEWFGKPGKSGLGLGKIS
jgi:hypothetical protein